MPNLPDALFAGHFDGNKPRRWIHGVAISTDRPNGDGTSFCARGVIADNLPIPLLLEYNWLRPLGRVISLEAIGTLLINVSAVRGLHFDPINRPSAEVQAVGPLADDALEP